MQKIADAMESNHHTLALGDLLDSLLESSDHVDIGRVDDVRLEWRENGTVCLTHLLMGPQAFAGRIHRRLGSLVGFVLRNRFETEIPLSDVTRFGPTLLLRRTAAEYRTGHSEHWLASHILRWLPGSGYTHETRNWKDCS